MFGLRYKRIEYPLSYCQGQIHGAVTIEIDTISIYECQDEQLYIIPSTTLYSWGGIKFT
jgi:hypothetical protein